MRGFGLAWFILCGQNLNMLKNIGNEKKIHMGILAAMPLFDDKMDKKMDI